MSNERIVFQLEEMMTACRPALIYTDGLDQAAFFADKRTQDAVLMQIIVVGEAATRLLKNHGDFMDRHPE